MTTRIEPSQTLSLDPAGQSLDPAAAPAPAAKKRRRLWLLPIKIAVTVALCWWIFAKVDWPTFWKTIADANLWLILLILPLRMLCVTISAIKWKLLLKVHGVTYPLGKLHGWYLVSLFISQFLPSMIGGDSYRVYRTYRNPKARMVSVLAVFAERVTGMLMLLAMGFVAAIFVYLQTRDKLAGIIIVLGMVGIVIGGLSLLVMLRGRGLNRVAEWKYCPGLLHSVIEHSRDYLTHPREMNYSWLCSFLFHGLRVVILWLVVYCLGVASNPAELTLAVVAVSVIGMLPISLGGLGLMEGSFAYVMHRYGLPIEVGVAAMLLMRVLLLPMCAIGGVFFMLERKDETGRLTDLPAVESQASPEPGTDT